MRHSGSFPTGGAVQSSFAPATHGDTGEHLFGRPRWVRPKTRKGTAPAAFGQYATSHAVLQGGCPAIGDPAVAPVGRVRRRTGWV